MSKVHHITDHPKYCSSFEEDTFEEYVPDEYDQKALQAHVIGGSNNKSLGLEKETFILPGRERNRKCIDCLHRKDLRSTLKKMLFKPKQKDLYCRYMHLNVVDKGIDLNKYENCLSFVSDKRKPSE